MRKSAGVAECRVPTANPRLNLVLKPGQYELLSRLSRLQKRSRASIVIELLEQVTPVLERVCVVGEAAERARVQAKEGLRESMQRAEAQILPHVETALGQLDIFLSDVSRQLTNQGDVQGRTGAASGNEHREGPLAAPTPGRSQGPRPVTRGPGRGARRLKASRKRGSSRGKRSKR